MHIIPVIDVRHGIAVRAVAGDRANYQPLATPLGNTESASEWGQTHGSHPKLSGQTGLTALAIARGYRKLYPCSTIYIADLDGIEGRGANVDLAASLRTELPDVKLWIDAGRRPGAVSGPAIDVFGSEVLSKRDVQTPIPRGSVLSLDFRGDDFIGPPALLQQPHLWPARVIVMTLARVGADGGPDLARIAQIANLAPQAQVYAAGGIRDIADLRAARAAGAHGALIASALHAQKIKADDLEEITGL
ncbi:MAG: HisA/HisF-related TIM barrel protein [Hyphomicrobiaceae bacterium]|nr:HisA/HisF-related TIM barrel protein [Hyphomicrobiaceae bacterium]